MFVKPASKGDKTKPCVIVCPSGILGSVIAKEGNVSDFFSGALKVFILYHKTSIHMRECAIVLVLCF